MTRDEFITRLRRGLAGMPAEAIDDIVADYETHFAEGLVAGRSEDQVSEALGDPDKLARDLRGAARAESWDEPVWRERAGGPGYGYEPRRRSGRRRGYWRGPGRVFWWVGSHGVMGWVLFAIAIVVAISMLHVVLAVLGTLLAIGLVVALVVAIAALVFGGLSFFHGRWSPNFLTPLDARGERVSRAFAWSGGDTLSIALPADVEFTQSSDVSLSITGPTDALDRVVVEGGWIRYDRWVRNAGRLRVALSAPNITRFSLNGLADLKINGYRQDRLKIRIAGHGSATAAGEARSADVAVAGKGDVDLGALKGESVRIEIAGSGAATIAPSEIADIGIAGSGVVTLLTNPPVLKTRMAGAGRIIHPTQTAA